MMDNSMPLKRRENRVVGALIGLGLTLVQQQPAGAQGASTLDAVKARGALHCGVTTGVTGFSFPDAQGNWHGLDVDYCRALAAAVLGDASKVRFTPLSSRDRFTGLQSGEVDLLQRVTTWTLSRDTQNGFNFAGINFFDGQGFLVSQKLGVKSARELDGSTICVQQGTTTELNLADYFRSNRLQYQVVTFATSDETIKAFDSGRCDAFTMDVSAIASERLKLAKPEEYVVLPEVISKEPLASAVRHGDDHWFDVVKWVHFALLNAEELGIA
jgi:general L-amino acid transport system substrate-binding protein